MKIIGHRGSSFAAPENTRAAVRLVFEEKADGVEIDVHMTRDGRVAVIHDENVQRTTGMNAAVRDMSFDELRLLDAGSWKGQEWRCETIPELGEILDLLPPGRLLFVEIKCGAEILPALEEATRGRSEGILFVGFSLETLEATKRRFPGAPAIWNVSLSCDETGRWRPDAAELIRCARDARIDGLGLGYCEGVNADLVAQVRGSGLKLFVWTVDDVESAEKMESLNVDYLATNRPGWLRDRLGAD